MTFRNARFDSFGITKCQLAISVTAPSNDDDDDDDET